MGELFFICMWLLFMLIIAIIDKGTHEIWVIGKKLILRRWKHERK